MESGVIFTCFVALVSSARSHECGNSNEKIEDYVFTRKYEMDGDHFGRTFFEKDKILRVTDAYIDWPIYNFWWEDKNLEDINVTVQNLESADDSSFSSITLGDVKGAEMGKLTFDHVVTETEETLANSLLIPVSMLSCIDLLEGFLDSGTYSLYFSNLENAGFDLPEGNAFVLVVSGELHVSVARDCELVFGHGNLLYVPPKFTAIHAFTKGKFLAVKMTWEADGRGERGEIFKCYPVSLRSAKVREEWYMDTVHSSQLNSTVMNTGYHIHPVGLGTGRLAGRTYNTVKNALRIGYRLIDTSKAFFGSDDGLVLSEQEIGRAISESTVPREDIFLVTRFTASMAEKGVANLVKESLRNFRSDYIDLVVLELPFIHSSISKNTWNIWEEMKVFQEVGIIRSLGICNVKDVEELRDIVNITGSSLSAVQNWFDPFQRDEEIRQECKERNITYIGYGTLGLKRMSIEDADVNRVLTDKKTVSFATENIVSVGTFILRWAMTNGVVVTPCTSDDFHLESNYYSRQIAVYPDYLKVFNLLPVTNVSATAKEPSSEGKQETKRKEEL